MIKNLPMRIQLDPRGKIRLGKKGPNGYPVSLDYFDVDCFEELKQLYDERPDKLKVAFPTDDLDISALNEMRLYNSAQKIVRQCDGIQCTHRLENTISGHTYQPGEVTKCVCQEAGDDDAKKKCTPHLWLKLFVLHPTDLSLLNPYCYGLHTGGWSSIQNVISALRQVQAVYGSIQRRVFELVVKKVKANSGPNQFPVLELHPQPMAMNTGKLLPPPEASSERLTQLEPSVRVSMEEGDREDDPFL